jgi:hypothetical protein
LILTLLRLIGWLAIIVSPLLPREFCPTSADGLHQADTTTTEKIGHLNWREAFALIEAASWADGARALCGS